MVTGLLLAFNLPATIPLWQAALGGVVAIVVAKQMFGGIGQNFVNPALAGRIVLMGSFPTEMNNWVEPLQWRGADAVSSATPLALLANGGDISAYTKTELLFGMRPGCLGETCALALLLGFVYLVIRRVISPIVPVTFVGTVFVVTWLCGQNPVYHILSGGLLLGAIFMATDYTTSPVNKTGKVVFRGGLRSADGAHPPVWFAAGGRILCHCDYEHPCAAYRAVYPAAAVRGEKEVAAPCEVRLRMSWFRRFR